MIRISGRRSFLKVSTGNDTREERRGDCKIMHSMSTNPAPQRKGFLTQEAFAAFLLWLSPSQEQSAGKYLELRQTLVSYFVRKGCPHAEELTDRTLDRVALIVSQEPTKYPTPIALCCGVARRVWLEYLREASLESLEDENIPALIPPDEDFTEREIKCLESCLERLSSRDRELITQYHQYQGRKKIETRKHLAQVYGGLNKLRISAYRIRVRLHNCISGCVQRSALN
jgi:DNA-directed RNA polymerase specialized sigma24 family protein